MMSIKQEDTILAPASLILAATLWGIFWYPLRILDESGLNGLWATMVIYAAATTVVILWYQIKWSDWQNRPYLLLLLALASGWCNLSFIVAMIEGHVARVILLFYLSPLWTVILGYIFLHERLSARTFLVFLLAIVGAMTMLWDPAMRTLWPQNQADWLAISSGVGFAIGNVTIRALQNIAIPTKMTATMVGGAILSLCWIGFSYEHWPQASTEAWLGAVLLGMVGMVIMTMSVQYGVTHMPAFKSATILLFEIVIAALSALWLANEKLTAQEWTGGLLVVMASLVFAKTQKKI